MSQSYLVDGNSDAAQLLAVRTAATCYFIAAACLCSFGCHGYHCNISSSNLRNDHMHRMPMSSTVSDFYRPFRGPDSAIGRLRV